MAIRDAAAGLIFVWAMLPSIKGTQVTAETRKVEVGASAVTTVDQPERERRWLFFDFPQGNFGVDLVSVVGGTTEIVGDGLGQKDGPMNTRQLVALDPHVERNPDGYRFLKAHDQERLEKFVWAFTASAVVLYGLLIFLAARHFPLPAEERAKRRTAFGLALCTGVLLFLVSLVPLPPSLQFALACLVAPTFHIAGIGWAFEKNAKAYFSKAGAQRLWNTL